MLQTLKLNSKKQKKFAFPKKKSFVGSTPGQKLSAQRKMQICQSTAAPQVGQLFFYWWLDCLIALLGLAGIKAVIKHIGEIDPRFPLLTRDRDKNKPVFKKDQGWL